MRPSRNSILQSLPFASLALVLGLLAGCSSAAPTPPEPVVSVQTTAASMQTIQQVVTVSGVIFPIHQASLSPKISAPVRTFYVNRGDRVHKGQLLAVLDNRDLAAAVVSAQGGYDQAKATYASTTTSALPESMQTASLNVADTKANLDAQQKLFDSQTKLFQEGALARKQLDATQVALTAAKSAYESAQKHLANLQSGGEQQQRQAAKGQLESSHGQYLAASAQLQYSQLQSPIDGVIADRAVYPGDIAQAGTPLLVVMDTRKVVVRLHVPQQQAVLLKLGDKAALKMSDTETNFPGKITVLSPALDPNSTTVEVWVEADNAQGNLKPGTTVDVSITARVVPNAIVIPASAVLTDSDGKKSVMVVKADGRAYAQDIETGIREGSLIQIVKGLKSGDTIVATGAYGLPDKTKVKASPMRSSTGAAAPTGT